MPSVLYSSSVGAYAAGPERDPVDESWPATGIPTNEYSRQKADVEAILDAFEALAPEPRVVRVRPGLVFKRESASEQRRYFGGPFVPGSLLRRRLVVPRITGVRLQAVHGDDLGGAFRLLLHSDVRGALNVAAPDVLDTTDVARALGARAVPVSGDVVRAAAALAWRLRLTPITPSWLDLARFAPVMDTGRARRELGWEPRRSGRAALAELLLGIRSGAGLETPPLHPRAGGPLRVRELLTGVGGRP